MYTFFQYGGSTMNETSWTGSAQPQAMLKYLQDKASERKLRLFSIAACRRLAHMLEPELTHVRGCHVVDTCLGQS
jgi:hypothetical protein